MWQAAVLSAASGGLIGLTIWFLLAISLGKSREDQLSRRLRRIAAGWDVEERPEPVAMAQSAGVRAGVRRALRRFSFGGVIQLFLNQAGSRMSVTRFVLLHVIFFIIGAAIPVFLGHAWWIAALCGILAGVIPSFRMVGRRRKRFTKLIEQLPDALRMIISALRAGLGFDSGLDIVVSEMAAPISEEFRKLLNEWRLSSDMQEAFRRMTRRLPLADIRLFSASARLHREVGGNFTEVLEQLELTIRNRFQLKRKLKTMTAEARASGWVLSAMPLVFTCAVLMMRPDYMRPLFEHEVGKLLLLLGVGLELTGMLLIRWLTSPRIH